MKRQYVTSRPVCRADGTETTAPSLEELIASAHPEVARAARARKPFSFGDTTFTPLPHADMPAYAGRMRLFSLPGTAAHSKLIADAKCGVGMSDVQRLVAEASVAARAEFERKERWIAPYREAPTPEAVIAPPPLPAEGSATGTRDAAVELLSARDARLALLGERMSWVALAAATVAVSVALGWVAGRHIDPALNGGPVIAQPVCDPATGGCR